MIDIPIYPAVALVMAIFFTALWTTTANSQFWDKLLMAGRRYWTRWGAFFASAICGVLNVIAVYFLFGPLSSDLHYFVFFQVVYYLVALGVLEN